MKFIQPYQLIDRYDALLLDAYGVLVDKTGPLPGACDFIDRLNSTSKPYYLLTNSASRLPETMAEEFAAIGLHIPAQRIITSGMLLRNWVWSHDLVGQTAVVLGTEDSLRYAEQAGLRTVAGGELEKLLAEKGNPPAALVIADQAGFDLIPAMNAVLSMVFRQLDSGQDLYLVLCNPDLVYPRAPGQFGFTAGALAAMLEAILRERYGDGAATFERLGKPHPPLFKEAIRQAGSHRVLMVGDQLATDIVGANRCGIDSVLVNTGLAPAAGNTMEQKPTWRMSSLMIDFDP